MAPIDTNSLVYHKQDFERQLLKGLSDQALADLVQALKHIQRNLSRMTS
jgi:hypothetical protein